MKRTWMVLSLVAALAGRSSAAVNEVRVVAVQPDVQWHKAGAPEDAWNEVQKDTVLAQGDEVSCDPDGAVTLQFADNSTVVVKNTTQLKIASFFTEGGVVRTEILLKMGEVAAKVNKSEATKSDFRIKSPTGTASVRGTELKEVSYTPTAGMRVQLVEGFCNLGGPLGTTQVTADETGTVDQTGQTNSPVETQKGRLATDAYAPGSTNEEVQFFQSNVVVTGTGTSSSSGTGAEDVADVAAAQFDGGDSGVALQRSIDFNDGLIPKDLTTQNALVTQPGAFGPSSADGTPMLTLLTGGEQGNLGIATTSANFPAGATLNIEFDHNFITTEEPGQFFSNDDEFTATLVSNGGTPVVMARNSVNSSTFTQIDPATLPAVMNLPGGTPPEVAYQTGFQHFQGQYGIPRGQLDVVFQVRDADTLPGMPDTIIESAAQIDNFRTTVVQTINNVQIITPIGQPVGMGSSGQATVVGSSLR